jgi:hypothetical protein
MTASQIVAKDHDRQASHIKPHLSLTPEEYMEDRVVYKIKVYDRLSQQHRCRYQVTSLVSIVLAASVPVFINLDFSRLVPTLLSLIVTILVSMEKLFHFREHWRNYDEMAAFLRSEQLQFQTGAGEYKAKDQDNDKVFHQFVARIEHAISSERKDTIEMRTQENNAS